MSYTFERPPFGTREIGVDAVVEHAHCDHPRSSPSHAVSPEPLLADAVTHGHRRGTTALAPDLASGETRMAMARVLEVLNVELTKPATARTGIVETALLPTSLNWRDSFERLCVPASEPHPLRAALTVSHCDEAETAAIITRVN